MLQLKDLQVFTVVRAIFQLSDEIPCISAVVVALLAEVHLQAILILSLAILSSGERTLISGMSMEDWTTV